MPFVGIRQGLDMLSSVMKVNKDSRLLLKMIWSKEDLENDSTQTGLRRQQEDWNNIRKWSENNCLWTLKEQVSSFVKIRSIVFHNLWLRTSIKSETANKSDVSMNVCSLVFENDRVDQSIPGKLKSPRLYEIFISKTALISHWSKFRIIRMQAWCQDLAVYIVSRCRRWEVNKNEAYKFEIINNPR